MLGNDDLRAVPHTPGTQIAHERKEVLEIVTQALYATATRTGKRA